MDQQEIKSAHQQILEQVSRPIEAVKMESGYRLKLILAATIAVMAIMVYLIVIIATIYVSIVGAWMGSGALDSVNSGRARGMGFMLFVLGPLFAGLCVLVALLKPVLIPAADDRLNDELELNPNHESVLFEFVRRLCGAMNAPMPAAIAVNSDVNASASFLRGPFDGKLKLTVGMPLVLGMNVQQLAGVLAHEFGHFTQRSGMRLTWLIGGICGWFYRATFERDRWDQWLYDNSQSLDSWVTLILLAARGIVWLVRLVPFGLLVLCNFFCARLLQEMEFDADRYEARVSGSEAFGGTVRRLMQLGMASAESLESLERLQGEGRLPDNLSQLVVSGVGLLPPDRLKEMDRLIHEGETGRFDTHPSDKDRIANAAREKAHGTLHVTAPASILFRNALALSRTLTINLYRQAFQEEYDPKKVLATTGIVEQLATESAERQLSENFLLHQFQMFRTFTLPRETLGNKVEIGPWKKETQLRRQQLLQSATEYVLARRQIGDLVDEMVGLSVARMYLSAETKLEKLPPSLAVKNLEQVRSRLTEIARREQELAAKQESFRRMQGQRLLGNLEWLRSPAIRQKLGRDESVIKEVSDLLHCYSLLRRHQLLFERFNFEVQLTASVAEVFSEGERDEWAAVVVQQGTQLGHYLASIRHKLQEVPYAFEHGEGGVSVGYYLLPEVPDSENPQEIMVAAAQTVRSLVVLVQRIVWRLTSIAAEVEQAMGFGALDLPQGLADAQESA